MMTVSELSEIIGGKIISGNKDLRISGFTIDSRSANAGCCFVAIKGERHDGNDFIKEAFDKGAAVVLSEDKDVCFTLSDSQIKGKNRAFVLTDNVYDSLRKTATLYRERYIENVIAVTGSVGKTTVKELIYSVLSERIEVNKTEGNKNNLLGLPLTVLSGKMSKNAIFELGISNFGEMSVLSSIAKPNVSLITNIGNMHIEGLLSRENIAVEKLKITKGMESDGFLFINGDEPLLANAKTFVKNTVEVSEKNENASFFVYNVSLSANGTFFDLKRQGKKLYTKLFVPVLGRHGAFDAAFAVAVGDFFGCTEGEIRRGLKKYIPCGDRQRIEEIDGSFYLFDCYNAGPESFEAALNSLEITAAEKSIENIGVVAGSMLELGEISKPEHIKLGEMIARLKPRFLITVGEEAFFIGKGAENFGLEREKIISFPNENDIQSVAKALENNVSGYSLVLIKGSRRMRLERLRSFLKKDV